MFSLYYFAEIKTSGFAGLFCFVVLFLTSIAIIFIKSSLDCTFFAFTYVKIYIYFLVLWEDDMVHVLVSRVIFA